MLTLFEPGMNIERVAGCFKFTLDVYILPYENNIQKSVCVGVRGVCMSARVSALVWASSSH